MRQEHYIEMFVSAKHFVKYYPDAFHEFKVDLSSIETECDVYVPGIAVSHANKKCRLKVRIFLKQLYQLGL